MRRENQTCRLEHEIGELIGGVAAVAVHAADADIGHLAKFLDLAPQMAQQIQCPILIQTPRLNI